MSHMPTTLQPSSSTSTPSVSLTNASGGTVVLCTPVYSSAAGSFSNGRADTLAHATLVGLLMSTTLVGASGLIQTDGVFTADTSQWDAVAGTAGGLTFGTYYYLDTVAGKLSTTSPSTPGQFVTLVGYGLSITQMRLLIQPPIGL